MKEHSGEFPVKKMAEVLRVTRSRYYAWKGSPQTRHKGRDNELAVEINRIFEQYDKLYGSPRIWRELIEQGNRCSRKRVARIMREKGLRGRQKRVHRVTTDSRHEYPVSPNLVQREFSAAGPNQVWVSDITYIATWEGWLYLCIVLDLYSRMVVGWAMESHMRAELATGALVMAVTHRRPSEGLIFHSDRGIQYASNTFREKLASYKMIQSMSRKGDCWDNACAESFFATLKTEEVFRRTYKTREQARESIFHYIEVFYNRRRKHSFLDYLSPADFEVLNDGGKHAA